PRCVRAEVDSFGDGVRSRPDPFVLLSPFRDVGRRHVGKVLPVMEPRISVAWSLLDAPLEVLTSGPGGGGVAAVYPEAKEGVDVLVERRVVGLERDDGVEIMKHIRKCALLADVDAPVDDQRGPKPIDDRAGMAQRPNL